jgi:hypothetical protein
MDELKKILISKGVSANALKTMNDNMVKGLAKALNVDPTPFAPREVKIEIGKNGAPYVVTSGYAVPKRKDKKLTGETSLARGLYVRAEAIDDIINDLQIAKELLKK